MTHSKMYKRQRFPPATIRTQYPIPAISAQTDVPTFD